jgi:hypothetical protein
MECDVMRNRKTAAKELKKPTTPADVLMSLRKWGSTWLEALEGQRGATVDDALISQRREFVRGLKELEVREALQILCMDAMGSLARELVSFDTFPTKKVRFKVFPQTEEKLERLKQYKEPGKQTMKDSIDTVLELLFNRLPKDYKSHKSDVAALLSPLLPPPGGERPVSLSMNSLGYALLQDLAELLGESQGAVLEAATAIWLIHHNDLRAKREEALNILNEFRSQAAEIEDRLKGMFDDPEEPVCCGFGTMMFDLENLQGALRDYVTEGKARWREWNIYGNYE